MIQKLMTFPSRQQFDLTEDLSSKNIPISNQIKSSALRMPIFEL